jgi:3-oxoacyl-[acyl-carrier protein] reductase
VARSVLVTGASNGIGRGIIDRPAADGFFPVNLDIKPPRNDRAERVPVCRGGMPTDIANAVAVFLGEAASFVTGPVLYGCGGMTVGRAA